MAKRPTRATRWTPAAIPVGMLLMLLGAWAFFAPLVGPYFHYGFFTSHTWAFGNGDNWKLLMFAGGAIFVGGLTLTMPSRGLGSVGSALAFAGGAWLLVGPSLYPALGMHAVRPLPHSTWMTALLWIGCFYGVGGLTMYLAGTGQGLLARRTAVEDMPVIHETPIERSERSIVNA